MHKVIAVLEEQLAKEIKSANEKLTSGNLDAMFKLSETIHRFKCMENDGEPVSMAVSEMAESVVKKYSNGRYDHNIDDLYDAYIEAKKKYKEVGDQGHRDKLMECVGRLMTEVYDMLSSIALDADFKSEKDEVMKRIRMLADM